MPALVSPLRNPIACALVSGFLLVLSFPKAHLTLLALVALAPLTAALTYRRSRLRLFSYGYLTGLVFFGLTFSWIYDVMRTYGYLSRLEAGGVLILFAVVFAVYFGAYALAVGELARRWQLGALVLAPFVWVVLEWIRTYAIFGGFPWNLLGYAVAPHTSWIQPAAFAGIYGVSFLVVAVNAVVAAYWLAPSPRRAVGLLLVAAVLAGGELWMFWQPAVPTTARALLVQTNLPQQEQFDPNWVGNNLAELEQLIAVTRNAARGRGSTPSLVVWPEVPVSFYFHRDPVTRARLLQVPQATGGYFLVGIVDYRADAEGVEHPYNSAALVSPAGEFVGQYDKIHLVPFGEYLPLGEWLSGLGPLVEEVSAFRPGSRLEPLPAGGQRLGILICYEAIFPAQVRQVVERGADVLVNLSNDGWYGRSAAPEQSLSMARVRAVETRRFLLRATNNGYTAVFDPLGRLVAGAPVDLRLVLRAAYAPRSTISFYVRNGDWFVAFCALLTLAALARKLWVDAVERD